MPTEQGSDTANKRLKRYIRQKETREKKVKRNAERRRQANDTLTIPMNAYYGTYHYGGYHDATVQDRNGNLFIDGSDRSMPFTLALEHVSENTKSCTYMTEDDGSKDVVPVSFRIDGEELVSSIGIGFEETLGDEFLFWIDRTADVDHT